MSSPIPPKLQNAVVVAWPPPLNRSTFDTTNLQHFDAAERAPSTASKADIEARPGNVRFIPNSGHTVFLPLAPTRQR
jgi:hypothetical protein